MKILVKVLLVFMAIYLIEGCKKDELFTGDVDLSIRADTVWFDTVFTKFNDFEPKSVNKQFLIINPLDEVVKPTIKLMGGSQSQYRLNVDGESGHYFDDIEILPNDSIFVFVEIHTKNNQDSKSMPIIVRDSILFQTNKNEQFVQLIGWGQDAHYFKRDSIEHDVIWSDQEKPYVVYDYFYVKPGVKLTIEKGVKVHFNGRGVLFVEGQLDIRGTLESPVMMQGDRLQPDWEERDGQWEGIWLSHPSYGSTINYLETKNGRFGVFMDSSSGKDNVANVVIKNTIIRNMQVDGIAAKGATVEIENSVITNCGRYTFLGSQGGDYLLNHCTFYTGNGNFSRQEPTWVATSTRRNQFGGLLETYDLKLEMNNCIAAGANDNEVGLDVVSGTNTVSLTIINNVLKTTINDLKQSSLNNVIYKNGDKLIISDFKRNYELDSLSIAKNIGRVLSPVINKDLLNRSRNNPPDAGAYESQF